MIDMKKIYALCALIGSVLGLENLISMYIKKLFFQGSPSADLVKIVHYTTQALPVITLLIFLFVMQVALGHMWSDSPKRGLLMSLCVLTPVLAIEFLDKLIVK